MSAELVFDQDGDLVDIVSGDRSRASAYGKSFTRLWWNTPISRYHEVRGRRIPVSGCAMWSAAQPEGHFSYIEFYVDDLTYNLRVPDIDRVALASGTARRPNAVVRR